MNNSIQVTGECISGNAIYFYFCIKQFYTYDEKSHCSIVLNFLQWHNAKFSTWTAHDTMCMCNAMCSVVARCYKRGGPSHTASFVALNATSHK